MLIHSCSMCSSSHSGKQWEEHKHQSHKHRLQHTLKLLCEKGITLNLKKQVCFGYSFWHLEKSVCLTVTQTVWMGHKCESQYILAEAVNTIHCSAMTQINERWDLGLCVKTRESHPSRRCHFYDWYSKTVLSDNEEHSQIHRCVT